MTSESTRRRRTNRRDRTGGRVALLATSALVAASIVLGATGSGASAIPVEARTTAPSPTPTASASPGGAETSISPLEADAGMIDIKEEVTVSGLLTSADPLCVEARRVLIQSQPLGSDTLGRPETATAGADGVFSVDIRAQESAEYFAQVEPKKIPSQDIDCPEAFSAAPVVVLVRAVISASTRPTGDVTKGSTLKVSGRLDPAHEDPKVRLQRKKNGSWHTLKRTAADSKGAFEFSLKVKWLGKARFRVTWPGDVDHEGAKSDKMVVKAKKPKDDDRGGGGGGR